MLNNGLQNAFGKTEIHRIMICVFTLILFKSTIIFISNDGKFHIANNLRTWTDLFLKTEIVLFIQIIGTFSEMIEN